jgi:hypothetical protein
MIIIMQRTLEYVVGLSKTPNLNSKQIENINMLWEIINPDDMIISKKFHMKYIKIDK